MSQNARAPEGLANSSQAVSDTALPAFEEPEEFQTPGSIQGFPFPSMSEHEFQKFSDGDKREPVPPPSPRKESWTSSSSTSSMVSRTLNHESLSPEYQVRYLTEHMAKLHPFDRNVWYRKDHCMERLEDEYESHQLIDLDSPSIPQEIAAAATRPSGSNVSGSPYLPSTPVVHVTAPSQSSTPKPGQRQPPNSSRPRRKSEVGRNRIPQDLSPRARAQSVGARPKGVHFADDPVDSPPDAASPNTKMPMTGDPMYIIGNTWGPLYVGGQATKRWKGFLADIARDIVHLPCDLFYDELANPFQTQGETLLRPKHLYDFYREFEDTDGEKVPFKEIFNCARGTEDFNKLDRLYQELDIERFPIVNTNRQIEPCLGPEAFAKWMITHMSAHPSQEARRVHKIAESGRFTSTVHSPLGSRHCLPSTFPRHLVPDDVRDNALKQRIHSLVRELSFLPGDRGWHTRPPVYVVPDPSPGTSPRTPAHEPLHPDDRGFAESPRQRRYSTRRNSEGRRQHEERYYGEQQDRGRRATHPLHADSDPLLDPYLRDENVEWSHTDPRTGRRYHIRRPVPQYYWRNSYRDGRERGPQQAQYREIPRRFSHGSYGRNIFEDARASRHNTSYQDYARPWNDVWDEEYDGTSGYISDERSHRAPRYHH